MKRKTTFLAKAFLMLFAVLLSAAGAKAQQAIPYSYGFEDNDLATDGWTIVDGAGNNTKIITTAKMNGDYGFQFYYNTNPPQYLISPELTGTDKGVAVSFYYRNPNSYTETFMVGYSTTTNGTDAFTWDTEITSPKEWTLYENTFPAGTKFVAVKYTANNQYKMYLDDFTFAFPDAVAKPTGLKVSYTGGTQATLSWSSDDELFDIDVNGTVIEDVENPYTLTGLAYETEYTVMVRAKKDGEVSKWSDPVSFTTGVQFPAPTDVAASGVTANTADIAWTGKADSYTLRYAELPGFFEDFENVTNNALPDGWTTIDADGDGNNWFTFTPDGTNDANGNPTVFDTTCATSASYSQSALTPDNWLISPQLDLQGTMSVWLRAQDPSWTGEHFAIYLSLATDIADVSDFTIELVPEAEATGEYVEYTADLSAYAGQKGYIAIRHFNCTDMFRLNVDNFSVLGEPTWVTIDNATSPYTIEGLTPETAYVVEVQGVYADGESAWVGTNFTTLEDVPTPSALAASDVTWGTAQLSWTENGTATEWEICLNGDLNAPIPAQNNPFILSGLTPETEYTAKVRALQDGKCSKWSDEITFTTDIRFYPPTGLAANNITATSAEISWTADATATSAVLEYADATGAPLVLTEYKYDNGTLASTLGISAEFSCAAMFPAGSFTGSTLSKVSLFDSSAAEATVTIYSGGDAEPETAIASKDVSLTNAGDFVEVDFGVSLNPTQNVWVVVTFPSGGYYAVASDELGDANGRWSNLGSGWVDLASVGGSGYCWMVRAIFATPDPSALTWTTVADATSPAELTGLTPGTTYAVRVKSIYGTDGESKWAYTSFTTEEENPVPSNIAAELAADGAVLTWEGKGDSYNVRYRQAAIQGETYFEDDLSTLDNWTVVTAGEGPGWTITDEVGANAATAYSWKDNNTYNADNWLISPAVELGGKVTFSVNTSTSYPDSYEVLLSTTGTETTDFTTTLQAMAEATPGQVSIDLSAYSGTGHIAIHHVSSDCYLLVVWDFNVYGPDAPAGEWTELTVAETTATLSGLATNNAYEYQVQSVKDGSTSEWSAASQFALLTLANDADNKSIINKFHDMTAHVTLADRTIYKDGTWNTVYLPFDLTPDEFDASPLAGADVRTLRNALTVENESVTMNFTDAGAIESAWGVYYGGVPYIMKWDSGSDVVSPEFANVTITKYESPMKGSDTDTNSGIRIVFKGTYAPIGFTAEDTSILFIGANNKINHPLAGAKIGAMRAYFQLEGASAGEGSGVKIFTNLDDLDDATGIANIEKAENTGDWYDISGRKLAGKPSVKGIYVNGGRKVTIK